MNDVDGMELLARAKQYLPDAEVIMVTGHASMPKAVEAMQQGAFNFLEKPITPNRLRAVAERAADAVRLRRDNLELNKRLDERFGFEGIIYASESMKQVIDRVKRIAPDRRDGADHRRQRHGQGTDRPGHPPEQPAQGQAALSAELRRRGREPGGKRVVRARERGLYRCPDRSGGSLRIRQWRHAVPGRGRRHAPGHADETAARAGGEQASRAWGTTSRST